MYIYIIFLWQRSYWLRRGWSFKRQQKPVIVWKLLPVLLQSVNLWSWQYSLLVRDVGQQDSPYFLPISGSESHICDHFFKIYIFSNHRFTVGGSHLHGGILTIGSLRYHPAFCSLIMKRERI